MTFPAFALPNNIVALKALGAAIIATFILISASLLPTSISLAPAGSAAATTLDIVVVPPPNTGDLPRVIRQGEPLDDTLHVIMAVINPGNYQKRADNARRAAAHWSAEDNVALYVVEMVYGDQEFQVAEKDNPRHLQLRTNSTPIWHKENIINIAARRLLPPHWRAMAWVDAGIDFENPWWALDTLRVLNGHADVVQMHSHAADLDPEGNTAALFHSFGYQYAHGRPYVTNGTLRIWHAGYTGAMTRRAFEQSGGLWEFNILGSGDHMGFAAVVGRAVDIVVPGMSPDYAIAVREYQERCRGLRMGYVPGVVRHRYHGNKVNRKYQQRLQILVEHGYAPRKHLARDEMGVLVPTRECPPGMLEDIVAYFDERREDD